MPVSEIPALSTKKGGFMPGRTQDRRKLEPLEGSGGMLPRKIN